MDFGKNIRRFHTLIITLLSLYIVFSYDEVYQYGYSETEQAKWGEISKVCTIGQYQSPIQIIPSQVSLKNKKKITIFLFNFPYFLHFIIFRQDHIRCHNLNFTVT